jgi:hypothetical protein
MTFVVFSDVCSLSIDFEVYCDVSIDLGLGFYWLWSLSNDFCSLCQSIDFEVYCDVSIDLGLGFYWLWSLSDDFCSLFW